MFIDFLYELRRQGVPVGTQEAIALADALARGLHESSLDGFYHVARALCIHSESHLDDFDRVFSAHFKGIPLAAKNIAEEFAQWLQDPIAKRQLSAEERSALEELDLDEVMRRFKERLAQQKERHDGGNHWIGTGGTSPFGTGGTNPRGLQLGSHGGSRSGVLMTADARHYRSYRNDITLDIRQIEVALRKLRAFSREGNEQELDTEGTIDATARNAGELTVVTRPPRRSNTRVILVMDVGGSMDPHAQMVSQLFSAAKRATHWRELRTYYFHNCPYGLLYRTEGLRDPVRITDLFAECGRHYKLVFVGDALMAPYELFGSNGGEHRHPGLAWLMAMREHFSRSVWLNPEGVDEATSWHPTASAIAQVFPMFALTLAGLGQAVDELVRDGRRT